MTRCSDATGPTIWVGISALFAGKAAHTRRWGGEELYKIETKESSRVREHAEEEHNFKG